MFCHKLAQFFLWFSQWCNHDFFAKNGYAANNQKSPSERRPPQISAHMSLGTLGNLHRGLSKNFANCILVVYYFKASKNCKNEWPQFCSAKKGQFYQLVLHNWWHNLGLNMVFPRLIEFHEKYKIQHKNFLAIEQLSVVCGLEDPIKILWKCIGIKIEMFDAKVPK